MALLPENLYSAAQARELERLVIAEGGVSAYQLMQRAGQALLGLIQEKYPGCSRMLIVGGGGNNAGDGYVLARLAQAQGIQVDVLPLVAGESLEAEAQQAYADMLASTDSGEGWQGKVVTSNALLDHGYDIIVDAILGIGLSRLIEGETAEYIGAINSHPAKVVAADIPSGIDADSGAVMGCAVQANMTLSFLGLKQGLMTGAAPDYCGEIYFNDLQVPESIYGQLQAVGRRIEKKWVNTHLTRRPRTTHKGLCGHVLIMGGNRGMSGAVLLAGQSALRAGAGLVSIATRQGHAAHLNLNQPELMCHGIAELKQLKPLIEKADVIAIGPGLGDDVWAQELFKTALQSNKPLVVDADALSLLSQDYIARGNWVLTPHPGEAARLSGVTAQAVQKDRCNTAKSLAEHYNAVVVLKGAGTIVAGADSQYWLCDKGNPGMASGGMGDCLTGIVSALIAQGLGLEDAAACASYLHGLAGDRAAKLHGERGMLASDLLDPLRKLINP